MRLVQQLEAAAQQMRKSNRLTSAADLTAEAEEIRKRVPESAWQMLKEFDERAAAYRSGNASTQSERRKFQSRRPLKPSVVSTFLVLPFLIQRIGAKRWNGFALECSRSISIHCGGIPIQARR